MPPIKYVVLGKDADGRVIERWFCRRSRTIDLARLDMYRDNAIKHVTVVMLCLLCGAPRTHQVCSNPSCPTRLPALEEAVNV